jgi:hypothetical protein
MDLFLRYTMRKRNLYSFVSLILKGISYGRKLELLMGVSYGRKLLLLMGVSYGRKLLFLMGVSCCFKGRKFE